MKLRLGKRIRRVLTHLYDFLPLSTRRFIYSATGFAGWWTETEVEAIRRRAKTWTEEVHPIYEENEK